MSNFENLLKKYVNTDYDELLDLAKASLSHLIPLFSDIAEATGYDRNAGVELMLKAVFASIAADGKVTSLEHKFFCDLAQMQYSFEEVTAEIQAHYTDENEKLIDQLYDMLEGNDKTAFMNLVLCICAVDEKIAKEESAFIVKLFS